MSALSRCLTITSWAFLFVTSIALTCTKSPRELRSMSST